LPKPLFSDILSALALGGAFIKRMNPIKALTTYIRACVEEAKKVAWPTRQETIRFSSLVIGVSLVVAVFFGAIDAGFSKLVSVGLTAREQAFPSAPAPTTEQPVVTPTVEPVTPTINLDEAQPIITPTDGATQ
jgi:preprotein translocase SecE subunit